MLSATVIYYKKSSHEISYYIVGCIWHIQFHKNQQLPLWGILAPRGHLGMSGDILVVTSWRCYWYLVGQARDGANYSIKCRIYTQPKGLVNPITLTMQRLRNHDIKCTLKLIHSVQS